MTQCTAVMTFAAASVIAGAAAPAHQRAEPQHVSSVSATAEVVQGKPQVIVRVTNHGNVPLAAWEIVLRYTSTTQPNGLLDTTTDANSAANLAAAQIPPQGTRERIYVVDGVAISAAVSVNMALFDDLTQEGASDSVAFVLAVREKRAVTLTAWLDALRMTVGKTPQQAKKAIAAQMQSDARLSARSDDSFGLALRQNMAELLDSGIGDAGFSNRLLSLTNTFAEQRDRELRHKRR